MYLTNEVLKGFSFISVLSKTNTPDRDNHAVERWEKIN